MTNVKRNNASTNQPKHNGESSPVGRADTRTSAAREQAKEAAIMEAEGKLREAKHKADTVEDARTQAEKFEDAAREFGTDQDEDAFKGVLRKLGKAKR